jgi:hypothetical protein
LTEVTRVAREPRFARLTTGARSPARARVLEQWLFTCVFERFAHE